MSSPATPAVGAPTAAIDLRRGRGAATRARAALVPLAVVAALLSGCASTPAPYQPDAVARQEQTCRKNGRRACNSLQAMLLQNEVHKQQRAEERRQTARLWAAAIGTVAGASIEVARVAAAQQPRY